MIITEDTGHILVIDDDDRIRQLLSQYLHHNNFLVSTARDTKEAREILKVFNFDLLILDIMLPGETGKEFARVVRMDSNIPILMLTAMRDVEERISGLESGADDYLAKPFEPRELLLRVSKIISRAAVRQKEKNTNMVYFGEFAFNIVNHQLTKGTTNILLTQSEAKLLFCLSQNIGHLVSRSMLAELCGGINERSVDVQIIRLRNKIEKDPKKPVYVQSVRGEGYILYK